MNEKDISAGKSQLLHKTMIDYIISLTHLYGLVHKDKAAEIYNLQNEEKIDIIGLDYIMNDPPKNLADNFVKIYGSYFVHETIMVFGNFENQLNQRRGKPFYIPAQEELLKYKEDSYFEVNKQYRALLSYVSIHFFDGDELKAEMLCEEVQGICQFNFSLQEIFEVFNTRGVVFESEKQVNEVVQLIMELANNTRLWENNGYTPKELLNKHEKMYLRPLPDKPFEFKKADILEFNTGKKVGRNDPCPCGSGKKYKKCCLGK
jgi:hypothetical protein